MIDKLKKLYADGIRVSWTKGKKLSGEHKNRIKLSARRGKSNSSWLGNKVGYYGIHNWLITYYGKADKCENREDKVLDFICSDKSKIFQWARIKGHRYSRNKKDYYQLCVSCHSKYDAPFREVKKCKLEGCEIKRRRYGYCDKHSRKFINFKKD